MPDLAAEWQRPTRTAWLTSLSRLGRVIRFERPVAEDGSGALPLVIYLPAYLIILLVGGLPAYRVLMVWVYDRTESMLVAMLMHASYTACALILTPLALAGVAFLAVTFAGAAVLWVFVAAVAVSNGGHLTRQTTLRRRVA